MFGAMHFISYTNRLIATKVDLTYLAIDQHHTEYMSCGESWTQTRDVEITESDAFPLHHTCQQ